MTWSLRAPRLSPLVAVLALAACSPDAEEVAGPPASTPEARAQAPSPTPEPSEATVGGDGSAIDLQPLTAQDLAAETLAGELACSFSDGDDEVRLS